MIQIRLNKFGLLTLLMASLLAGCRTVPNACASRANYYLNPEKPITAVGRVALIELDNLSPQPDISVDATDALFEAIQKRNIFGLHIVRRSDPACKGLLVEGGSNYSLEQLAILHKNLKADAVLIGEVTQYYPYPHLAIGLRLKLTDLRDGTLLWAMEQFWDSTDKQIEKQVENFFKSQVSSGYEPMEYRMAMVSPHMFLKFVAWEVGQTLHCPNKKDFLDMVPK